MSAVKRGQSGLSGVLLVDKPSGMTSHDVVNRVRRAAGERRVGHAGTLDPSATGLLVVLVGPATRLEPYLSAKSKVYEATVGFGVETDTDDAEGAVVREAPVSASVFDEDEAKSVLGGFLGDSLQTPPQYSAIKVGGRVAHRVARAGGETELQARPIRVYGAELLAIDDVDRTWLVEFAVSKGTYIRSLARDIGAATESAAHLVGLRRTSVGAMSVDEAHTLEQIDEACAQGTIPSLFIDPVRALGVTVIEVAPGLVDDGRPISVDAAGSVDDDALAAVVADGRLAALYRRRGRGLVAEVVFATPVARAS